MILLDRCTLPSNTSLSRYPVWPGRFSEFSSDQPCVFSCVGQYLFSWSMSDPPQTLDIQIYHTPRNIGPCDASTQICWWILPCTKFHHQGTCRMSAAHRWSGVQGWHYKYQIVVRSSLFPNSIMYPLVRKGSLFRDPGPHRDFLDFLGLFIFQGPNFGVAAKLL